MLIIVTPYVTTMIIIIITGDRIEGMKLGAIPGLILPHLIFGLTFIMRHLTTKFLITALVTATIYGLLIVTIRLELIKISRLIDCLGGIAGNVYVYDGLGFRSASLSHVAKRN